MRIGRPIPALSLADDERETLKQLMLITPNGTDNAGDNPRGQSISPLQLKNLHGGLLMVGLFLEVGDYLAVPNAGLIAAGRSIPS